MSTLVANAGRGEEGRGAAPVLSVLVPAFDYADGVRRILQGLHSAGPGCEVVVFDDSRTGEVEAVVAEHAPGVAYELHYRRNQPPLGPVANWNALLDAARGDYCLLMHHDEFPISRDFAPRLVDALIRDRPADVFVLDCLLTSTERRRQRRHVPGWVRSAVVQRWPAFLFRRNVIGPTAALVVRRALYPRFNPSLRWLVDVDMYYRLFRATPQVRFRSDLAIGSVVDRTASITARLAPVLREVSRAEQLRIAAAYPAAARWCGPLWGGTPSHVAARALETCLWAGLRAATRGVALNTASRRGAVQAGVRP